MNRICYSLILIWLWWVVEIKAQDEETCANPNEVGADKFLEEMTFNVGHGNKTALVYVSPDVSTFYQQKAGSRKIHPLRFHGHCAKFINISPQPVKVFWDPGRNQPKLYISDIAPFEAAATAAYPTHVFVVTPKKDPDTVLQRFQVTRDEMLYVYDPIQDPSTLSNEELKQYTLQKENLEFAASYKKRTGRDWLALHPKRGRPHFMWDADYFGQQHVVTTTETHFVSLPPETDLAPVTSERRQLQDYRSTEPQLNLTLTVLSCEPRVFEIQHFLSETEVHHILEIATGMSLRRSTTRASGSAQEATSEATRTSRNTWVSRTKSPILDTIYRRAADLLQLDEALLRRRTADEYPDLNTKASIAEDLQLVHYDVSQQYTPHHDFSIPNSRAVNQPARFATVLFYLNDDMKGGETSFPRWKNAETGDQLKVTPEVGKAILFYSFLPDGNMDERSEHAALPVIEGEKWLTNLWGKSSLCGYFLYLFAHAISKDSLLSPSFFTALM